MSFVTLAFIGVLFVVQLGLYYRKGSKVFIYLPGFLMIYDFGKNLLDKEGIAAGFNGFEMFSIYTIYVLLPMTYHGLAYIKRYFFPILIFTIYLGFRIDYSISFVNFVTRHGSVTLVLLMMSIGAYSARNILDLNDFKKMILFQLRVFSIVSVVASILKLGPNMYNTGIYYGFQHAQINGVAVSLGLLPLMLNRKLMQLSRRELLEAVFAGLLLVISFRRTPVIIIAVGVMFSLIFSTQIRQKFISILAVIVVVTTVVFISSSVGERRSKFDIQVDYQREGRYLEAVNVYEILSADHQLLMGNGTTFHNRGMYGFRQEDRPLHVPIIQILFGAGFLGAGLFLIIGTQPALRSVRLVKTHTVELRFSAILMYLFSVFIIMSFVGGLRYYAYAIPLLFFTGYFQKYD